MRATFRELTLACRCLIAERMIGVARRIMPPAVRDEDVYALVAIESAAGEVLAAAGRHLDLASDALPLGRRGLR